MSCRFSCDTDSGTMWIPKVHKTVKRRLNDSARILLFLVASRSKLSGSFSQVVKRSRRILGMAEPLVKNLATQAPRFKSVVRKLAQHGSAALQPQVLVNDAQQRVFLAPMISKRVANTLRKQAIRDGTFGSFDGYTGIGWDPQWDVDVAVRKTQGQGRHRVQPPKKSKRERTRESRAEKIEEKMEGMDERLEEVWATRHANKPSNTFENRYKAMMRGMK